MYVYVCDSTRVAVAPDCLLVAVYRLLSQRVSMQFWMQIHCMGTVYMTIENRAKVDSYARHNKKEGFR